MSRWFRHYAGLCRDEKLVSVAIKSRQPVERVVWIWAAILESAAEIDDDGRYSLDAAEVAYFLRADESDILAVETALQSAGRLADGAVVRWSNRQFSSDRSKDRVAAHRERKRAERDGVDVSEPSRNGDVTLQTRHGNSPETELETDTDTSVAIAPDVARAAPRRSANSECLTELGKVLDPSHAQAVLDHRNRLRKPMTPHAAALLATSLGQAPDPNAAADEMISRGWLAWKPDWGRGGRGPPNQPRRNTALEGLDELERRFKNGQQQQQPTLRIAG